MNRLRNQLQKAQIWIGQLRRKRLRKKQQEGQSVVLLAVMMIVLLLLPSVARDIYHYLITLFNGAPLVCGIEYKNGISFLEELYLDKMPLQDRHIDEIRTNDHNMNITRYIDITEEEEPIDVQDVLNQLKQLKKERIGIEKTMNRYLKELGFEV